MSCPQSKPAEPELGFFGIRHHGPGCARSLERELTAFNPDVLLVEGPPDANDLLLLAGHLDMQPPVALLIYELEKAHNAVYYPFAEFSPEWRAIQFGYRNKLPVRLIDLPQCYQLATDDQRDSETSDTPDNTPETRLNGKTPPEEPHQDNSDPFILLAKAAGYNDIECWWDQQFERGGDITGIFQAIQELMTALREADTRTPSTREQRREAHMRQCIRQASKEGFVRLAIVAGAWHIPKLKQFPPAKQDQELLKNMAKVKVAATWTPWTYQRLTKASGYGAGIMSPGYYEHVWHTTPYTMTSIAWMIKVARLLRESDLEGSPASSIEAARLADALAAMRRCTAPGLSEFTEAAISVFCHGNDLPLQLIHSKLIVGEKLGKVPDESPMVPLQSDLRREQKRLRLSPEASDRLLELDLRKPNDLDRSHLLHRLNILDIPWGKLQDARGKGTFHENWTVKWEPEFEVRLIEASIWGASLIDAASARSIDCAQKAKDLSDVTAWIERVLLADLPQASITLITLLETSAATSGDVGKLMDAAPPLMRVMRYGNVRQTDSQAVANVVNGLLSRICVGLSPACNSLSEEAAEEMLLRLNQLDASLRILQDPSHLSDWITALQSLSNNRGSHGLIQGRSARMLLEHHTLKKEDAGNLLSQALSPGNAPAEAAAWIDGFLRGSGLLLIHNPDLWKMIDNWILSISAEYFQNVLPVLRRTFSSFTVPERKQMANLAVQHQGIGSQKRMDVSENSIDLERASQALPILMILYGADSNHQQTDTNDLSEK